MITPAVSIPVFAVVSVPEGYAIHRNGVALKTPANGPFIVPAMSLAEAIAEEWRAQAGKPNAATMPMTQLAATCIDITSKDRSAAVKQVVAYASSELLCHHVDHPQRLAEQQQRHWQPLLDWCVRRFDVLLRTGQGVMPITQSPEALQALCRAVESYDDFRLTGLKHAVEVSGSLVLGLALAERYLTAEEVFHAAELDGSFQMQIWGEDPASKKRRESIRNDLAVCEKFFALLGYT